MVRVSLRRAAPARRSRRASLSVEMSAACTFMRTHAGRLARVHHLEGPGLLLPVVEDAAPALDPDGEGERAVEQRHLHDPEVHHARAPGGVDRRADDGGVGAHDHVAVVVADLEREHHVLGRGRAPRTPPGWSGRRPCACRAPCCRPSRCGGRSGTGPDARRRAARRRPRSSGVAGTATSAGSTIDMPAPSAIRPSRKMRVASPGSPSADQLAVAEHHAAVADAAHRCRPSGSPAGWCAPRAGTA